MEFPSKGIWSIVFVTGEAAGRSPRSCPGEDLISVFMPTGMLPPSGFVCFVPRKDVLPVQHERRGRGQDHHLGRHGEPGDAGRLKDIAPGARQSRQDEPTAARRVRDGTSTRRALQALDQASSTPPGTGARPRRTRTGRAASCSASPRGGGRAPGPAPAPAGRRRAPPPAAPSKFGTSATRNSGMPLWRAPSTSPPPRSSRSFSAIRKPSSVSLHHLQALARGLAERRLVAAACRSSRACRGRRGRAADAAGRGRSARRARSP